MGVAKVYLLMIRATLLPYVSSRQMNIWRSWWLRVACCWILNVARASPYPDASIIGPTSGPDAGNPIPVLV